MAVKITLTPVPSAIPAEGWIVNYKKKGDSGAYITPAPFLVYPIEIFTADAPGTLYEGIIQKDCGVMPLSSPIAWETPCVCTDNTYAPSPDGSLCQKTESLSPTISNSGYCLATSTNGAYSGYEGRIYQPGVTDAQIGLSSGTAAGTNNILYRMTISGQWANPTGNSSIGPMNRSGVWIDSDCSGVKNSLTSGAQTTVAGMYNNLGGIRTVYVGIGADNGWILKLNGVTVNTCGQPSTPTAGSDIPFKIWHIIPVVLSSGVNYFNIVARGDGSVNDSLAMVVYDNTPIQIRDATSDAQLNILFNTVNLRGTSYDVATCSPGYSLDVSGGQGNYICRRTITKPCNSAS